MTNDFEVIAFLIPSWATSKNGFSAKQRELLGRIWSFQNHNKACYLSKRSLASDLDVSDKRIAFKLIKELESKGVLIRYKDNGKDCLKINLDYVQNMITGSHMIPRSYDPTITSNMIPRSYTDDPTITSGMIPRSPKIDIDRNKKEIERGEVADAPTSRPASLQDVIDFFSLYIAKHSDVPHLKSLNLPIVAEKFYNHFEDYGWKGKDWRLKAQNWLLNEKALSSAKNNGLSMKDNPDEYTRVVVERAIENSKRETAVRSGYDPEAVELLFGSYSSARRA